MSELLEMATELVLSQIRRRAINGDEMRDLLSTTHATLLALTRSAAEVPADPKGPESMDWRKSIRRDYIACMVCGQQFRQLGSRHLADHGLDRASYRRQFGIPSTQPLSATATTARRREVMMGIRPWEKAIATRKRTGSK
jgi:predicted transcriptional regulator